MMSVQMQPSDLTQADRDEVDGHIDTWVRLSLDRDFEQLVDKLATEDVMLLPPDHPACNGKAEALAYLNDFPEIVAFTASLTSFHGRGDTAIGQGVFDLVIKIDGESKHSIGKWLTSYRKTTDGWKIQQDMWNSDEAMI
jgi:ketosteroid isomerase-like protein